MKLRSLAACALIAMGCGTADMQPAGSLHAVVSALSSDNVTSVVLTYTLQGGTANSITITPVGGIFETILAPLATGTYDLSAVGRDASNAPIFQGTGTVTITQNHLSLLSMLLQQIDHPVLAEAPVITAFTISNLNPTMGDVVTASMTATNGLETPITYSWAANCGITSFSPTNTSSTSITTTCNGPMVLTASATANGVTSRVSATLNYSSTQGADIAIALNNAPVITSLHPADGQVAPGESDALFVVATDPEGGLTNITWSLPTASGNVCSGAQLNSVNSSVATFIAPSTIPASGLCDINVSVTDQLGGAATGVVSVAVSTLN